ncbi:MAG TPA: hypothetical protein VH592_01090 [Gemmataceae bacterium]|jgi:hypothetical protein
MIDRTDLQLMICEQIMDTDNLLRLFSELTGSDMLTPPDSHPRALA